MRRTKIELYLVYVQKHYLSPISISKIYETRSLILKFQLYIIKEIQEMFYKKFW